LRTRELPFSVTDTEPQRLARKELHEAFKAAQMQSVINGTDDMSMEYVYPAIFHANDDGSYTITYPDLPGCISEGKSLANAVYMAQSALSQWIEYLIDKNHAVPHATDMRGVAVSDGEFVNLIRADVRDGRAVKRTVSIPKWMDDKVSESRLSLSRVLQDALSQRLQ
jgi:predicted RNase H-like HicB family nuclease